MAPSRLGSRQLHYRILSVDGAGHATVMNLRVARAVAGLVLALSLAGCERSPGPDQLVGEWVSDTGGRITFHRDGRFEAEGLPIDFVFEDVPDEARPSYFDDEKTVRRMSGSGTWAPQEAPGKLGVVLYYWGFDLKFGPIDNRSWREVQIYCPPGCRSLFFMHHADGEPGPYYHRATTN